MVHQQYAAATLARDAGAHQPRRAAAQHDDIMQIGRRGGLLHQ